MNAAESQMTAPPYLQGLNPPQREAVETLDGPVLVLAGAGTGKTRVLTARLAHILHTQRAWPQQILAVTFTNKAAQEMRERVSQALGGAAVEGWWLGTFHALAARMLRRHADLAGLDSNFTIIDPDDQTRLLKQLMEDAGVDTKKWNPKHMIGHINRWKDKACGPGDLSMDDAGDAAGGRLPQLYRQYQDRLQTLNACDFGDLMLHMIRIFKNPGNRHILQEYQQRFKYILVDEYQDTNTAQYMWLRLLTQGHDAPNICCVGDEDQSIYGWRGAEVGNILRFEQDFPGARVVRLEQNYRSTGHILGAASHIIANNEGRLGKTLHTAGNEGEKVTVRGLWDGMAEARWVGEEIEALQNKKWSLDRIAVLVRAGFQTREFEERFIQLGLPYRVLGGLRFYERQEIRDALAYLRVLAQPDDDLALERIINVPKRGIGNATVQTLYAHARGRGVSLSRAIADMTETDELRPKVRNTLKKLTEDFTRWRAKISTTPHAELAGDILEESSYIQMWQDDKSPDAPGRLENLKELIAAMGGFETMQDFLEHVALVLENQDNQQGEHVTLMTLHSAKGLEFDAVFLPGWEEGLFPSQRTVDELGMKGLEEERRLAYVGITRARQRAYISYAANRRMYGKWISAIPSRFVDELPEAHVQSAADSGLYNPGRSQHWDSSGFQPQHPQTQAQARPARQPAGTSHPFAPGTRVRHDKFGNGTVIHVQGHKLDIKFDTGGAKRVLDSFVEKND